MENRIYGKKVDINADEVKSFFEKRFIKENPLASVMARANPDDGVADKRNENEVALINRLIDFSRKVTILDVGCGLGRWATNLFDKIEHYDGIDFTKQYIDEAKNIFSDSSNINFFNMSATDISSKQFSKKYNLIIINGIFVYMNDSDVEETLYKLKSIVYSGGGCMLYLRESVSTVGERLTLSDFYSEELKTAYNAVYRTPEEYEYFVSKFFSNYKVIESNFLLTEETGCREETNQKYWLIEF